MGGDGRHCRVGEVIRGNVDCLDGGYSHAADRDDAFLHTGDFTRKRRLVPDRRGEPSEQPRNLGASLDKAEKVVHKQKDILSALVTKIF